MGQKIFALCIFVSIIIGTIESIEDIADLYSNDRSIEYTTNVLTHSKLYKKVKFLYN